MDIEYLREFTVVAELGSFSRAAEELCISQSALSKHILSLERELGAPLLVRNSRNVTISPAGAKILPMAAEIYSISRRILVEAARESGKDRKFLRLASIPVMAQYNITGALADFQRKHPDLTLEVEECEQHDLLARLREGKSELAFTRAEEIREPDLEYLPFCDDCLVAVLRRDHPLAKNSEISLLQLKKEPLLFMDSRTGLYHLCCSLCSEAGFAPDIVYTGHRPENIVSLCEQGMGTALLMKGHTDYIKSPQVVCVEITPRISSTICLVRMSGRNLSAPARAFWEELSARAERI